MSGGLRRTALAAVCVCATASALAAQEATTVTGRVRATGGAALVGATVTIPQLGLGAITREDGRYSIVVAGARPVSAQQGMGGTEDTRSSFYARTPFEKQMQHEIVCTCGACGHQTLAECRKDNCGQSHQMRGDLAKLIVQKAVGILACHDIGDNTAAHADDGQQAGEPEGKAVSKRHHPIIFPPSSRPRGHS